MIMESPIPSKNFLETNKLKPLDQQIALASSRHYQNTQVCSNEKFDQAL